MILLAGIEPTCRSPLEAQFSVKAQREAPSLAQSTAEAHGAR